MNSKDMAETKYLLFAQRVLMVALGLDNNKLEKSIFEKIIIYIADGLSSSSPEIKKSMVIKIADRIKQIISENNIEFNPEELKDKIIKACK